MSGSGTPLHWPPYTGLPGPGPATWDWAWLNLIRGEGILISTHGGILHNRNKICVWGNESYLYLGWISNSKCQVNRCIPLLNEGNTHFNLLVRRSLEFEFCFLNNKDMFLEEDFICRHHLELGIHLLTSACVAEAASSPVILVKCG